MRTPSTGNLAGSWSSSQALENQLFQLASFALDPEHIGHGRRSVADLWFGRLVDKASTSVGHFLDEHGEDEPEFSGTPTRTSP
jgi:hypothetical protein